MAVSVRTRSSSSGAADRAAAPRSPATRRGVVTGAVLVWMLTSAVSLVQLFGGPTVGLADNGDASRLMCRLGLQLGPGASPPTFESRYVPAEPCPIDGWTDYRTSWRPVVELTVWLQRQLTGEAGFDVAALGVLCSLLLGAGAALLFLALPGRLSARGLLVGPVVAAACDIGFVSYFNSGYSDPAGFLGLVFLLAGLVGFVTRRSAGWLVLTMGSAAFLSTAKTQLVVTVGVVAIVLVVSCRQWTRPPAPARWRVRRPYLVVAGSLALVAALAAATAKGQGAFFSRGNKMNMLFFTLLPDSPDPARDLRRMGLPPSLARYSGTGAWAPTAPYHDPAVVAHQDRIYSWRTYGEFLLDNPDRLVRMARRSSDAVLDARVDYLGNLAGAPGGPVLRADRPSPVFALFDHLPHGWPVPVLALVWLAGGLVGLWWLLRSRDEGRLARGVLLATTAGYAASQSLVALSDGYYEIEKHGVHAAFASALLLALLAESAVRGAVPPLWRRLRRARADSGTGVGCTGSQPGCAPRRMRPTSDEPPGVRTGSHRVAHPSVCSCTRAAPSSAPSATAAVGDPVSARCTSTTPSSSLP